MGEKMKAYTISDVGRVRRENQDCIRFYQTVRPASSILALCDGMGGAKAGKVAGEIGLSVFMTQISELICDRKRKETLSEMTRAAAVRANESVFDKGAGDKSFEGMGTTLVAAVVRGGECCIVNVGDSRAYLISDSRITQITRDHSFVEEMVGKGAITRAQALNHPRKNVITRALGVDRTVDCDIFSPLFQKNDLLLLCSDGLSNTLSDNELLEISQRQKPLELIGQALLALALSRGAPDNVTIGLLRK
ncbi:MAG: Stp1/IreP family PP2C-type Ser/Thr phosphatase [Oscillospiraceae bacterium]|jgi:protein phosphatase|nr:Stp1/IreP family PP2C-type Ser/Thr phosphatase [Oscillospiraceae bacterium]